MRYILLTLLFALPLILALPTTQSNGSSQLSLFGRFSSLLQPGRSDPLSSLHGYENEDAHSPPLPREGGGVDRRAKTSSKYRKCGRKAKRNGFAHYAGWKIVGNDLSGALPVSPRENCIQLCNAYGNACGGVYFEDQTYRCFLKGDKIENWKFVETDNEGDSVDLVGGCAAWSEIVPEDMDEICCRD